MTIRSDSGLPEANYELSIDGETATIQGTDALRGALIEPMNFSMD